MFNLTRFALVAILLFTFSDASALRCGTKLILEGDFVLKVLKNCGKPIFTDFMLYNNHLTKLMVYKKNGRNQYIYLRNNFVVEIK